MKTLIFLILGVISLASVVYAAEWGHTVSALPKKGDSVLFKENYTADTKVQVPNNAVLKVGHIEELKLRDYGSGKAGGLLIQGYNVYLIMTTPGYTAAGSNLYRIYCEEERYGMEPSGRIACSANITIVDSKPSPTPIPSAAP